MSAETHNLPEFIPEDQFCAELKITRRHGARLRDDGLPYTRIGKRIFIHREGGPSLIDGPMGGSPRHLAGR